MEEAVVLPDAVSGATYRNELSLPPGLVARQGPAGVELVDAAGTVVATYGGGTAFDCVTASPTPARRPPPASRCAWWAPMRPGTQAYTYNFAP